MRYVLSFFVALLYLHSMQAQITAGLAMNQQINLTGAFTVGSGWSAAAWLQVDWNRNHSLRISTGNVNLSGYNHSLEIRREFLTPDTLHLLYQYSNIRKLQYWQIQVAHLWQPHQRWSFELGGRVSYLRDAKGRLDWRHYRHPSFNFALVGVSTESSIYYRRPQFDVYAPLQGFDLGPEIKARFRVFLGCWLEGGLYQGFLNQWAKQPFEEPRLFITSASLGLSLQIARLKS